MKIQIATALVMAAILGSSGVSAVETKTQSKGKAAHSVVKPDEQTAAPAATGPVGFGALKIGMSQQSVRDLKEADGTYLVGDMETQPSPRPLGQDVTQYKTQLVTPLSSTPFTAILSFRSGILNSFSVTLDDVTFEQAKSQLVSKYGEGESTDNRKDEQCLYGNGANFKVNSGSVTKRWIQHVSDTREIRASAVEFTIDMCPPSLRGPRMEAQTSRFIAFDDVTVDNTPKPNAF